MQADQRPEPYTVLEYQSSEPRVFGVEIRARHPIGLNGLLAGIRWVGKSEGFRRELTFVVMTLPTHTESHEIGQVVDCARAERLVDKLCLVVPANAHARGATIAALQRLGVAVLLGGVGRKCRFSDMTDHPINGVVIEPDLVSAASGDPHAASILDAIVALAANLGLKSFANDCTTQSEFDLATSAGISYVTYAGPFVQPSSFASRGLRRAVGRDRSSLTSRDSRL
jgi:predicted signal transduction protein with EAL and GGDEF domain